GWPKRIAVNPNVLHPLASSFHRGPEKNKRERESERKTSHRQKKWRSGYREATVNKEEAGYDGESWCRLNTI
ncbi:unnamed protein product, partial [Brassica oleracea]